MYEYIQGLVEEVAGECVILDVNGLGFEIFSPLSSTEAMPTKGEQARLFTHFHVREDIQRLYGFLTKAERELFRQLISISKVGPKVALSVLSGLSVDDILYSIQTGDASRFKAVSGIGPKTAQRLVLELKGKISMGDLQQDTIATQAAMGKGKSPSLRDDAYAAMIALGYNESQVVQAISRVEQIIEPEASVEEWIKKALQVI